MKRIFILAILVLQPMVSGHAWASDPSEKERAELQAAEDQKRKDESSALADSILSGSEGAGGEQELDPSNTLGNALLEAEEGRIKALVGLTTGKDAQIKISDEGKAILLKRLAELEKTGTLNTEEVGEFSASLSPSGQVPASESGSKSKSAASTKPPVPAPAVPTEADKQLAAAKLQVQASATQLKAAELNALTAQTQGATAVRQAQAGLAQARAENEQARTAQQQAQAKKEEEQKQAAAQQAAQQAAATAATTAATTPTAGAEGDKNKDKKELTAGVVPEVKSTPGADGILKLLTASSGEEKDKEGGSSIQTIAVTSGASPKYVPDAGVDFNRTVASIYRGPAAAGGATVFPGSVSGPQRALLDSAASTGKAVMSRGYGVTSANGSSKNSRFIVDNQASDSGQRSYEKLYDAEVRADAIAKSRGGKRSAEVLETVSTPAGGHKGSK